MYIINTVESMGLSLFSAVNDSEPVDATLPENTILYNCVGFRGDKRRARTREFFFMLYNHYPEIYKHIHQHGTVYNGVQYTFFDDLSEAKLMYRASNGTGVYRGEYWMIDPALKLTEPQCAGCHSREIVRSIRFTGEKIERYGHAAKSHSVYSNLLASGLEIHTIEEEQPMGICIDCGLTARLCTPNEINEWYK